MRKFACMLVLLLFAGTQVLFAQTRNITGTVTGTDGEGIPGVTVIAKGTTSGGTTNIDGKYNINVPSNSTTLVFSFVGMKTLEIPITGNVINVTMESAIEELEQVVVVGYGTGKKISSVVGSTVKVDSKQIQERPSANALDALQGKVAGLQVYTSSGEPTQLSSIRLHGVGSLSASSTPLYVLDGIPMQSGTMLTLNPQDFESITILKDASATSIYGSRAANGVVYITTKNGRSGERANITVKSQYGISNLANEDFFNSMMNTKQLTDFQVAVGQRTQAQIDDLLTRYPNDTRWHEYYYKQDVPTYSTDIAVSGGTGATNYYVSGGYFYQDGLAYRSAYDRFTLRSNLATRVNTWMRLGLNLGLSYDDRESNGWGTNNTNRGLAMLAPPYYTPYDADGNEYPNIIPGWNRYNPKYLGDNFPAPENYLQINPTGFIEITPLAGLTLKTQAGMDATEYRQTAIRLPSYLGSVNNGSIFEDFWRRTNRTITNTAEYKFNLGIPNNFILLGGYEWTDYKNKYFSGEGTGLTDDRILLLGAAPNNRVVNSSLSEYAFQSIFGRLEYNFNEKYFADFTVRQDGSSRFGKDNRTANFYAAGVMWNAFKEPFLENSNFIQNLVIKASLGTSGNSEIGNYNSFALVGTNQFDAETGFAITTPGNPMLGWEEQFKTTAGLKFSLFKKLHFDLEAYMRNTSNMLINVPYPFTTGFSQVLSNVGTLQNKGLDFALFFDIWKADNRNFLTPYVNFNYNKDKVTELFQGKDYWLIPNTGVTWVVGQPVSFFYPIWAGVNPETGAAQWYLPGDDRMVTQKDPAKVTSTFNAAALQQNTGISRYAPFNGGFGFSSSIKGIYLQADFSFSSGKSLINNDRYFFENPNQFPGYNQMNTILDYWQKPGDNTTFPRYGVQFTQFDSRLIEDASFMRLKNLAIGYTIPSSLFGENFFFKGIKVFATGRNLLTWTKYLGPDPEVDSNLTYGVNPNTKQISAGIELNF